jgi:hypothetical protein
MPTEKLESSWAISNQCCYIKVKMMVVSCENLLITKERFMRILRSPWTGILIDFHIYTGNVDKNPTDKRIEQIRGGKDPESQRGLSS